MAEPSLPGVLITRPEPGASETAGRIASLGFTPILTPMLSIRPSVLPPMTRVQAVLVTSANAIPALAGLDRATTLFAVGDATAARAAKAGFTHVASAGRDARALADLVIRKLPPETGSLLLASGAGQGLTLAAQLRDAGFRVRRRVAYAAQPAQILTEEAVVALCHGQVSAALFFSAETGRAFVRALAIPRTVVACVEALVISPATALAVSDLPWRRVRVASHPNQDDLVALLP